MRELYFKLPLAQPRFHWKFSDKEAFLRGRLTLRIIRDSAAESIVVFDGGVISQGWRPITSDQGPAGGIYFGFHSSESYMTTVEDSLEIELVVVEDLEGIGRRMSAVLPAGTYRATGSYSNLTGTPSDWWLTVVSRAEKLPLEQLEAMPETRALVERLGEMNDAPEYQGSMECWRHSWQMEPTGAGWLSPEMVAEMEASESDSEAQLEKMKAMFAELGAATTANLLSSVMGLGTDGEPCG